jgi:hypothetical protein
MKSDWLKLDEQDCFSSNFWMEVIDALKFVCDVAVPINASDEQVLAAIAHVRNENLVTS